MQTLKGHLAEAGLPVMENPSHIVPVMVGDPVHCKAVTDTLLEHYGFTCSRSTTDRAAGHRAHAAHALAGAYRRADGGLIPALKELWARCPVANGQYVRLAAE